MNRNPVPFFKKSLNFTSYYQCLLIVASVSVKLHGARGLRRRRKSCLLDEGQRFIIRNSKALTFFDRMNSNVVPENREMEPQLIKVVNPTAARAAKQTELAGRRYRSLDRKQIGLFDNNKPNADKFLAFVGAFLKERYEGIELVTKRKMSRTRADCLQELSDRCDVVVNAFGD